MITDDSSGCDLLELGQMVDHQRNKCLIPYLDNATFLPSKVKVVIDSFSERFQKNIQQNHPVKSLKQIILLIIPL